MLRFLTLILVCQLLGETVVGALDLPAPGPVLGMVALFALLMALGDVPPALEETAGGLLRAMSLLFVPAGAGVMLHVRLLGEALAPLGLALIVSTLATIAVTALLMRRLGAQERDDG